MADTDILSVRESFAPMGELVLVPGREISNSHLREADVLLVRSITRVNEALLSGTRVRLVGSATSGVDHVDLGYLRQEGIQFFAASGCNANAVVDYCLTALSLLFQRRRTDLYACSAAVIGAGNVGGLLVRKLRRLGIRCTAYDPLLPEAAQRALQADGIEMVDLPAALDSDIVSLHVPLTCNGRFATRHLLSTPQLQALRQDCVLLNTSRGEVVDGDALKQFLAMHEAADVVLDVWEREPALDPELLERVTLGTPHIAGYSVEAKRKATSKLREQVAHFIGGTADSSMPDVSTPDTPLRLAIDDRSSESDRYCTALLSRILPLSVLHAQLRSEFGRQGGRGPQLFDSLRKQLADRREFAACQLVGTGLDRQQRQFLQVLGFDLIPR